MAQMVKEEENGLVGAGLHRGTCLEKKKKAAIFHSRLLMLGGSKGLVFPKQ